MMLTSDLVLVRAYKGEIRPRYLEPRAPEHLALATQLIEVFAQHVGAPRHALDAELADLLGMGTAFLLHRGLAKLLRDRCTFDVEAPCDPVALREATFVHAAAAYRGVADDGDEHEPSFDREAVLREAAETLDVTASAVESALYADLKSEQVLQVFDACRPEWLLDRYNLALAQGVLYKARALRIRLAGRDVRQYRALFRKIKFFQLLHRVSADEDGSGTLLRLDGPLSVLRASGRYGLQMASFLPTLLHFDDWSLEADLAWGKGRRRRSFKLGPKQGLRAIGSLTGQWQPEELRVFPAAFEALASGEWEVTTDAAIVPLGGQGVMVPDFVFRHTPTGFEVAMEVFGFWNKGAVNSRLRLLEKHGPPNVLLAVSKALASSADAAAALESLPGDVYVFRSTPLPRQVRKRLDAMLPKPKKKRRKRAAKASKST